MDAAHLLLVGVGVNLLFTLAHALFHSPAQSAKIDAIEAKVDNVIDTLTAPKGGTN
jgi:uncharacterized Rmd1/YagE family protein